MSKRKLVCTAWDDGTTVVVKIEQYDLMGSSQVGPIDIHESQVLSYPTPAVEDWRRDMAVLFVEAL